MECCRNGCPSGWFCHLHRGTQQLCQSDHWALGHLPEQGPAARLHGLAGRPVLGRVLVVPNFFHLRMKATVFLGTLKAAEYPSPDLCLDTILYLRSTDNSFDLMAWFLLWHALSTAGPYIDRCGPSQIMSNQLNLPQVESNQVVETSQDQWKQNAPDLYSDSHSKGSEYFLNALYVSGDIGMWIVTVV